MRRWQIVGLAGLLLAAWPRAQAPSGRATLFEGARLDFLVFDEAHSFSGALGGETACLIRRLRSFCCSRWWRVVFLRAAAAGDCTTVPHKQIVVAMGEGAKAGLGAFDFLIRNEPVAEALRAFLA